MEKFDFRPDASQSKYVEISPWFVSENQAVYTANGIKSALRTALQKVHSSFDCFVHQGSGWMVKKILTFFVRTSVFHCIRGGCPGVKLPPHIKNKRAFLSVESPPKKCFVYAVAASIANVSVHPERDCERYRKIIEGLPTHLLDYPTSTPAIEKFEKASNFSISIFVSKNVSEDPRKPDWQFLPHYVSEFRDREVHVELLWFNYHYLTIRSMSAMISGQCTTTRRKKYVCSYCLSYYSSQDKLNVHLSLCQKDGQRFRFPSGSGPSSKLQFKNFAGLVEAPFVMYLDTESLCEEPVPGSGKTISISYHRPISVCALTVCRPQPVHSSKAIFCYTGVDCIQALFAHLVSELDRIRKIFDEEPVEICMTEREKEHHATVTHCDFCHREFTKNNYKCSDHCHFTGAFRHSLCNSCNFTHAKTQRKIYVFCHNLSNYDAHPIIQNLHLVKGSNIKIIPKTSESYLSIEVGDVHFKDSFAFLPESLAQLAKNLSSKGKDNFKITNSYISNDRQRELMFEKGFFPYTHLKSPAVLRETSLPPKEAFYNDLTDTDISVEDYSRALEAWKVFDCKTLKDYMEAYEKTDVYLLADIFENFRTTSIKEYGLDPAHYFSSPHLSFDSFLRHSQCQLDLLTDIDMYLFFRSGTRGGVSQVSRRFASANNPYVEGFDPQEKTSYIMYLDKNNLYGEAMMQYLPVGQFDWMEEEELDMERIMCIHPDSDYGCIVQVTLIYPDKLHHHHTDLPVAPERMMVPDECLSPYSHEMKKKLGLKNSNSPRLMCTLTTKEDYVLHYRALQLYVKLGLKVTKISRGIKFRQEPIMKSYIEQNSRKRALTTNEFDSNFLKLMNNSLYGKCMEKPDKRMRVKLITDKAMFQKNASMMTFKSAKIINPHLVAVSMKYPVLKICKPIYMGQTILDLAKVSFLEFHYFFIKSKYGPLAVLLLHDTDSGIYLIYTIDLYEDLAEVADKYFDFSNYPKDHKLYSVKNKKVPGFMKDETASVPIRKFVGLRSKMYSFVIEDGVRSEVKTAKGVKRYVIKSKLSFADYFRCLKDVEKMEHEFKTIVSKNHQLKMESKSKVSLSPYDNKRYLLNAVESVPYGCFEIS